MTTTILRPLVGLLALLLFLGTAATARAGAAERLKIEVPPDVETLKPGEVITVQVVGLDADGARVGFGKKQVTLTASHGTIAVVKAPYEYRFTAPTDVREALTVRLSAKLEGAPRVRGALDVTVAPAAQGRYTRLVLKAPAVTVPFGQTIDVSVLGELADGTLVPLNDRKVRMGQKGPGSLVMVSAGVFRYSAPVKSETVQRGARVTLTASLERRADVTGTLELVLGKFAGGKPPPPPPTGEPGKDDSAEDPDSPGVTWPGGNLRVAVWRTRASADAEWTKQDRNLPVAGGEFVARASWQKLRVVVLRTDVVKVELEWWVGKKKGATVHVAKAGADDRFRLQRNKSGQYVCHLEGSPPDTGKPLRLNLLMTRDDGSILREELILRRATSR